MASMPLNFIDADRLDVVEVAVLQTPGNGVFHRFVDMLPADAEGDGNFLPGHASRPASKEPFVLSGQGTLAFRPGNTLHLDTAGRAFHPPHLVNEVHHDPPEWHKLEPSRFWHGVVTWTRSFAARTDTKSVSSGKNLDFNCRSHRILHPSYFSKDERLVTRDSIEDSLQLHPVDSGSVVMDFRKLIYNGTATGCDPILTLIRLGFVVLSSVGAHPRAQRMAPADGRSSKPDQFKHARQTTGLCCSDSRGAPFGRVGRLSLKLTH